MPMQIRSIVPSEILSACRNNMAFKEKIRVVHKHKLDGSNCSVGKDAACSITKWQAGWTWYCFRCGEHGIIPLGVRTPEETLVALRSDGYNEKIKEVAPIIHLPLDFQPMGPYHNDVPEKAYRWLYKYNIDDNLLEKFNIGWSNSYNRVIIPLYEYDRFGEDKARKLIGWCGRDVQELTKEERHKLNIRKYLIKRNPEIKHPLFHAVENNPKKPFQKVIFIVEDALSAIKINHILGCETFALLNTFVPPFLPRERRANLILLWLDGDQSRNMTDLVKRYSSWGINISFIWSKHDPKELSARTLRKIAGKKVYDYVYSEIFNGQYYD